MAFFALAIYILAQSAYTLLLRTHPATSVLGIGWLALTLAVMLSLAAGKHTIGTRIDNPVLKTEARVTLWPPISGAVLVGLVRNSLLAGGGPTRWQDS